jgi:UDPglucose--hexose-1-phosphate uridylyltransferase
MRSARVTPRTYCGVVPDVTGHDLRCDLHDATVVHVVSARQGRPNLPTAHCPFCVGGLEAPEPYDVRWFVNRWPSMPGDRCEVLLYTSDHHATMSSLGVAGVRPVVDLWAHRTQVLGARGDVAYVLCFENRGAEVGATISHPHGQIYAYDHVPTRLASTTAASWTPDGDRGPDPAQRMVAQVGTWSAWVPWAPVYPVELTLAPHVAVPDLVELDDASRDDLAALLVHVFTRLDALFDQPLPTMMWVAQAPRDHDGNAVKPWWCRVRIVSPWRDTGVQRFIAAAEVASGEFVNPVSPEDLARRLRP